MGQGRKRKEAIVETILECLDNYSHVYVYNMGNVRTGIVKTLRNKFAEDRFVMGKQTVMALGVGRSAEVEPFFRSFREEEYATAGTPATADYELEVGPLGFQHTMADPLRKLGLPVMLKNGAIVCEAKHKVCSKGKPLTPEQAQVLKLMDVKMGHVQLELKCVWTDGSYTELSRY